MLITELKKKEEILSLAKGRVFIINCFGCREIYFPMKEVKSIEQEIAENAEITGILTVDYICNPNDLSLKLEKCRAKLEASDAVMVFSCGVGVQTVARAFENKRVYAGCDTIRLPGFQGVMPLEYDCGQCGECYLNMTGGICPITACSKSLLNGPCGGSKDGMCEVDPEKECGWEKIYSRLKEQGRLDALNCEVKIRNF